MAEMTIESLHFTNPSMRSFNLGITAIIEPELDIGWISHVTVSVFYRRRLIGEKTRRNTYIIPNEDDVACINLQGLKIRDMIGFKAFMQRLMPKSGIIRQKKGDASITAAVDKDENGHNLSVAIDLNDISSVSVSDLSCQLVDQKIMLSFTVLCANPVNLPFGHCKFSLKKDEVLLASLEGNFEFAADSCYIYLEGSCEATTVKLKGTAVLKGVQAVDYYGTWIDRAIQLFELDVKLD
ncbi:hypothetical protein J3E69DRAFT_380231 [Trichoderma sp. SZMC 28015]